MQPMIPCICIFSPCPLCSMSTILTGIPIWDKYLNIIAKNSKRSLIHNNRAAVAKGYIFVTDDCEVYTIFYFWPDFFFVVQPFAKKSAVLISSKEISAKSFCSEIFRQLPLLKETQWHCGTPPNVG